MKHNFLSDPIGFADRGENPTVITKMKSGYAVIGLTQFLPGYCLLIRAPKVNELTDLEYGDRNDFLLDMSLLGDALKEVCKPMRINYSIYGNEAPFLHAHVFPRYEWEPEYNRRNPVWTYPESNWTDDQYQWNEETHRDLMLDIKKVLEKRMSSAY
ncbi:hypothetical protein BK126_06950 [Paenibacillus sp. FSL H7-0326]|uniref:HIT family protein n=1 Tax=Paenibacillus sp. FSL H7-0326 TaxID=1921144 RepID=UPI00096D1FB6|nr:HIT domain-containing protein [Paenibacillus sp. FSL H7-0326]OMC71782.1 hypothetical protein BK126_06950 [Paenibacillus sp. FSL H7-0326]